MTKPNPRGATFAERKAAAEGEASFVDPTPPADAVQENTTFAGRGEKAVSPADAEDKAVKAVPRKAVK